MFVEPIDRFDVAEAHERAGGGFKGRIERLDETGGGGVSEKDVDGFAYLELVEWCVESQLIQKRHTIFSMCDIRS